MKKPSWLMAYGHSETAVIEVTPSTQTFAVARSVFSFPPPVTVQGAAKAQPALPQPGELHCLPFHDVFLLRSQLTFEHILEGVLLPHLILCLRPVASLTSEPPWEPG